MSGEGDCGAAGPDPDPIDVEAIEAAADRALTGIPSWIWDGRTLPVPLEQIVDSHYMLLVRDVEDMSGAPGFPQADGASLSGLLLTALGEIWVNAEEARQWPARRRFTIGHELGHWVLHRDGQQSMFCRHPSVGSEHPDQLALDITRAGDHAVEPAVELAPAPAESRTSLPDPDGEIPPEEAEANLFSAAILMPHDLFRAEHRRLGGDADRLRNRFGCSEKATLRRISTLIA